MITNHRLYHLTIGAERHPLLLILYKNAWRIIRKIKYKYLIYIKVLWVIKRPCKTRFGLYSNFVELNYAYLNHNKLGNSYQISILFKLDNILSLKNSLENIIS